ncbi:MAG: hypothetical protein AAGD13_10230 [Pseudomonadota bacterium]
MENRYCVQDAPVGYRYQTIESHGKMLVPKPPFYDIVRKAFEGYANGRFGSQAEVKRFFESFPDFTRKKHGEVKQQRVTDILKQTL